MNNTLYQLYYSLCQITDPLLVGGCVRDMVINENIKDYDISIPNDLEDKVIKHHLERHGFSVKETGLRFMVLCASKNGELYEIAKFRKDGYYLNGKPEKVTPGDIISDANRRDFTVNALYFRWNTSNHKNYLPSLDEGDIIDPTGYGLNDLKTKTLRFVGKAKDRINEDPMRVFRFYRFIITKGFTPNPKDLRKVREMFGEAVNLLSDRGTEGMREEIEKMIRN